MSDENINQYADPRVYGHDKLSGSAFSQELTKNRNCYFYLLLSSSNKVSWDMRATLFPHQSNHTTIILKAQASSVPTHPVWITNSHTGKEVQQRMLKCV